MLESRTLTSHVQDDGFREIQLNGKQLFFLFMATTIVSVVIFLCGVLVGRGVRLERTALAAVGDEASTTEVTPLTPAAPQVTEPGAVAPPAGAPPSSPAGDDELRHIDATTGSVPAPQEEIRPSVSKPTAAPKSEVTPKPEAKPEPKADPAVSAKVEKAEAKSAADPRATGPQDKAPVSAPPAGGAIVVQVAAVNTRAEADTMAKKLNGKGYAAYVERSSPGSMFRVRVGPFATRRDAEAAADKLRRQENKNPWITRG